MKTEPTEETKIAVLSEKIGNITTVIIKMDAKLDTLVNQFITRSEFQPVKTIVYGMIGLILVGVIGAILALVLKQ